MVRCRLFEDHHLVQIIVSLGREPYSTVEQGYCTPYVQQYSNQR